jgi:hypothetical protein
MAWAQGARRVSCMWAIVVSSSEISRTARWKRSANPSKGPEGAWASTGPLTGAGAAGSDSTTGSVAGGGGGRTVGAGRGQGAGTGAGGRLDVVSGGRRSSKR